MNAVFVQNDDQALVMRKMMMDSKIRISDSEPKVWLDHEWEDLAQR